ncbi:MAG: mechanosensitive ion channel family protein [Gammaproteobacteria bacterium]
MRWLEWLTERATLAREFIESPIFLIQLAIVIIALGAAWYLARRLERTQRLLSFTQRYAWAEILRGLVVRIAPPACAFVLVLIGRGIMQAFGLATNLLDVVLALSFALICVRAAVFALRVALGRESGIKGWESTIAIAIWTAVALHLLGWLQPTYEALNRPVTNFGAFEVSIWSILRLLVIVGVFVAIARWLAKWIERRVSRAESLNITMRASIIKISHFVLIVLSVLIALSIAGIDLTALTVFAGAVGIGLGFGLQRIASNFIAGFVLVMDRSIRPGDVITIGQQAGGQTGQGEQRFGWVQELRGRYLVVRDRDGVDTLIPNETVITTEVINWSYADRKIRIKLPVHISYEDDPEKALELLERAADSITRVLTDPPPAARLIGFGERGLQLELRIWIMDPQSGVINVRSDVNRAIWRLFKEHGITIPYPRHDLSVISMPEH